MDAGKETIYAACLELGRIETDVYREYMQRQENVDVSSFVERARRLLETIGLDPELAEEYRKQHASRSAGPEVGGESISEALRKNVDETAFYLHTIASHLTLWLFLEGVLKGSSPKEASALNEARDLMRSHYNDLADTYRKTLKTLGVSAQLPQSWDRKDSPAAAFKDVLDELVSMFGGGEPIS